MLTCTIQKWGNSQGIRIPKTLLNELNIRENEILSLEINNNKLIIQKKFRKKFQSKSFSLIIKAIIRLMKLIGEMQKE